MKNYWLKNENKLIFEKITFPHFFGYSESYNFALREGLVKAFFLIINKEIDKEIRFHQETLIPKG